MIKSLTSKKKHKHSKLHSKYVKDPDESHSTIVSWYSKLLLRAYNNETVFKSFNGTNAYFKTSVVYANQFYL